MLDDGVVLTVELCGNWLPRVSLCRHKVYKKLALWLGPQLTMWLTTDQEEEDNRECMREERRRETEHKTGRKASECKIIAN